MDPRLIQRQENLFAELRSAPVKKISGVVAGSGGRFAMSHFCFTLSEWELDHGELEHERLTVRKSGTESEARQLMPIVKPYQRIVFRGHFLAENSFGSPQALILDTPQILALMGSPF